MEYFDAHVLIDQLKNICHDTLLNRAQKNRFIEHAVLSALVLIDEADLPALRAAWRMSKQHVVDGEVG